MPPRTTSRKTGVAARTASTESGRGKAGKAPKYRVDYDEAQRFLRAMSEWWIHLGGDVAAIERMLHGLKPGQQLSDEAAAKFRKLVAETKGDMPCVFPFNPLPLIVC